MNKKRCSARQLIRWIVIELGLLLLLTLPKIIQLSLNYISVMTEPAIMTSILILTYFSIFLFFIKISKSMNLLKWDWSWINEKTLFLNFGLFLFIRLLLLGFVLLDINFEDTVFLFDTTSALSPALLFFKIAIFEPVTEEIVFRGIIIGKIFKSQQLIGLFVSSLLFSAAHLHNNWQSFTLYALMGLGIGYAYYDTKRLETSIIVHCFNNLPGAIFVAFFI